MSDEGHNYTWSPPSGGWLTFSDTGQVIRDQAPGLAEFIGNGVDPLCCGDCGPCEECVD